MAWNDELKRQFARRSELSTEELLTEFGLRDSSFRDDFEECLRLFEQEYGISIGLLRASDPLGVFTDPPPTKNPISWFFRRAAYEDRTSELNFRLKKRRDLIRAPALTKSPMTVQQYVRAWLGRDADH